MNETKIEFRNVWRTHFKIESYCESLRQRLYKRPGFNIYEAFISCDLNDNGAISKEELRRLIESRGFYVSEKEVSALVEKIDRDRDGKITYAEVSAMHQPFSMMKLSNSYPYLRQMSLMIRFSPDHLASLNIIFIFFIVQGRVLT